MFAAGEWSSCRAERERNGERIIITGRGSTNDKLGEILTRHNIRKLLFS